MAQSVGSSMGMHNATNDSAMAIIEKTSSDLSPAVGSIFTITIKVKNTGTTSTTFLVRESAGSFDMVAPKAHVYETPDDNIYAVRAPAYDWTIQVAPNEEKSVSYTAKARLVGELVIGQTEVFAGNKKFYSNSLSLSIPCSSSVSCDESLGETQFTCPDKCGTNETINETVAPELVPISTPPVTDTIPTPARLSEKPPESLSNQKFLPAIIIAVVVLILVGLGYYFFIRKK